MTHLHAPCGWHRSWCRAGISVYGTNKSLCRSCGIRRKDTVAFLGDAYRKHRELQMGRLCLVEPHIPGRKGGFIPSFFRPCICLSIHLPQPSLSIHSSVLQIVDIGYAPGSVLGIGDTVASRRRQSLPSRSFPSTGHG